MTALNSTLVQYTMPCTPDHLITALQPLITRVRTDVTAVVRSGAQAWTPQPLDDDRLREHIAGGASRGVCPIQDGQSVTSCAVLDFDSHKGEVSWVDMGAAVMHVADCLSMVWGAQPTLFRSRGGAGVHLYLLWSAPQDARSVRLWLAGVLQSCDLASGTGGLLKKQVEVFPKQDAVAVGKYGNQVVLPLAGKSEHLEWDDLTGTLVNTPRDDLTDDVWHMSPPVPLAPAAQPIQRCDTPVDDALWRTALDVISNTGDDSLDYDVWRNVVFGIHYETGGSDEGLALAEHFSARSGKADLDFLRHKVWPYIRSDRTDAITGNTIVAIAREHGWQEPLEDLFDDLGDSKTPADQHGMPSSQHLTTDLANAARLAKVHKNNMLFTNKVWYIEVGGRWVADAACAYRYACQLSALINAEIEHL